MDIKQHLRKQFEASLAKVRFELQQSLAQVDVLNNEKQKEMLCLFSQRLRVFQHDFLKYYEQVGSSHEGLILDFELDVPRPIKIPELVTAAAAGGIAATAVTTVPVATTGMLWWTSSVTAVSALATFFGVGDVVATCIVAVVVGGIAWYASNQYFQNRRRRKIKKDIMAQFDYEVSQSLRRWLEGVINA